VGSNRHGALREEDGVLRDFVYHAMPNCFQSKGVAGFFLGFFSFSSVCMILLCQLFTLERIYMSSCDFLGKARYVNPVCLCVFSGGVFSFR
jgi:hypothetical protein